MNEDKLMKALNASHVISTLVNTLISMKAAGLEDKDDKIREEIKGYTEILKNLRQT